MLYVQTNFFKHGYQMEKLQKKKDTKSNYNTPKLQIANYKFTTCVESCEYGTSSIISATIRGKLRR